MKKWFLFSLVFVLFMATCFVSYVYLHRAQFLELGLSRSLGVPVRIHAFDITKKGFVIQDIRIQNPPSCIMKNAFGAEKIYIRLDFKELVKTLFGAGPTKITISGIKIDHAEMNIELFTITGSDTNWSRILAKLGHSSEEPSPYTFEIKKLVLEPVKVRISNATLIKTTLHPTPIAKIELHNLGSDGGIKTQDIFLIISKELLAITSKQLKLAEMAPEKLLKTIISTPGAITSELKKFLLNDDDK
jgi:hypothetical protein